MPVQVASLTISLRFLATYILFTPAVSVEASSLVGVSVAPLGFHPTTGIDHGEANTLVFLDLFKHATPFSRSQPERDSYDDQFVSEYTPSRLPVFQDGYPTSLYKTSSYRITVKATIGQGGDELPQGRYVLMHDGNGTLSFGGDAILVLHRPNTKHYVIDIVPFNGVTVRILSTDESDMLRNIQLLPEAFVVDGAASTTAPTFHPSFLGRLRGFNTIIFDGWLLVDDNDYNVFNSERAWGERPLPNQSTFNCFYTGDECRAGVPLEFAIELCNEISATPWFTMPDVVSNVDSFALNMARMVHEDLDASLGVAVQHRSGKGHGTFDLQRRNSLLLWEIFGGVFNGTRQLVRVVAGDYSTETLSRIGNDLITAQEKSPNDLAVVTVPFRFGTQCSIGCTKFNSMNAAEAYENHTVADLIQILKEAALFSEAEWLGDIARISKFTSGQDGVVPAGFYSTAISAASYGWRNQIYLAERCIGYRRAATKFTNLYSEMESTLTASGLAFYHQKGTYCVDWSLIGASVLPGEHNASTCLAACEAAGNFSTCGGVSYANESRTCSLLQHPNKVWGLATGHSCYVRSSWFKDQLTSFTQMPSLNQLDEVFRSTSFCTSLERTYAAYFDDDTVWTFDYLESELVLGNLEKLRSLEQSLEDRLIAATGSASFEAIATDLMVRWHRLFSNVTTVMVSGLPDVGPWQRLELGGKGGGASSMLASPNISNSNNVVAKALNRFGGAWAAITNFRNQRISQANAYDFLMALPASARMQAFTSADDPETKTLGVCLKCMNGTCVNGRCVCFRGFKGEQCSTRASTPGNSPPGVCLNKNSTTFGVNPSGISYWRRELTFVDVMKTSQTTWIPQTHTDGTWNTNDEVLLRKDGYPASLLVNQAVGTMMLRDLDENAEDGEYMVRWDGDGVLRCSLNVLSIRRGPGWMKCDMDFTTEFNNGLFLRIEWTNPVNPVTNVRVYLPGFDPGVVRASNTTSVSGPWNIMPFHPRLVDFLLPFPVLRFMDWSQANVYASGKWSDRPTLSTRAYTGEGGVPLELLILLSNLVGSTPYFNLPVRADDDFVRKFANMILSDLRKDVDIIVELANENWHTGFDGGKYAQEQADTMSSETYAGSRFCWTSLRTRNISFIFHDVFPIDEHSRLKFVLSSQYSNTDATSQLLACPDTLAKDEFGSNLIHGIAVTSYFDPTVTTGTAGAVLRSMWGALDGVIDQLIAHSSLVLANNISFLIYEAGPSGVGSGDSSSGNPVIAAHLNASMEEFAFRAYQRVRDEVKPEYVVHFGTVGASSVYGSYNLLESYKQDESTAPKYQAMMRLLDEARIHSDPACQSLVPNVSCASLDDCNGDGHCLIQSSEVRGGAGDLCVCFLGYSGISCSQANYIEYDTCGYHCSFNRGECVVDQVKELERFSTCECGASYFGVDCARFLCESECNFNGDCIDSNVCHCYPGYSGENCEVDCGCNGHGYCSDANTCVCDDGYVFDDSQGSCISDCFWGSGTMCNCGVKNDCSFGSCISGRCECWAGYSGTKCDVKNSWRPNKLSPLGMNIATAGYGLESIYVDVMKHSSAMVSIPGSGLAGSDLYPFGDDQYVWGEGQFIATAPNGTLLTLQTTSWLNKSVPVQEVVVLTLRDLCYRGTSGVYTVLFDGDGWLDFGMDAKVLSKRKGRIEIQVELTCDPTCWFDSMDWNAYCTDNGLYVRWRSTNKHNPLRNIRVIMPGMERRAESDNAPFHPLWIKHLERFNMFRFMDAMHTNNNDGLVNWADRALPLDRSFQSSERASALGAMPVEHMVLISNMVGATPWFCIPHAASDDFVRQFAKLVFEELRSDQVVYVEYSNEVWNPLFSQAAYAEKHGRNLTDSVIYGECVLSSSLCARARFHAKRTKEIGEIWRQVFAQSGSSERIKVVLGTWTSFGAKYVEEMLTFNNTHKHVDLIGITLYFGVSETIDSSFASGKTVDDVFDLLWDSAKSFPSSTLTAVVDTAAAFGLGLQSYEAGPSLVQSGVIEGGGATGAVTELLAEVQRDARMAGIYAEYLRRATSLGLATSDTPWMAFSNTGPPSKYGAWGHLEFTAQPIGTAPKFAALVRYAANYTSSAGVLPPEEDCLNPSCGRWGMGYGDGSTATGTFAGPPYVSQPQAGDAWRPGGTYKVVWSGSGGATDVYLWKGDGNCASASGVRVAKVARRKVTTVGAPSSVTYTVPAAFTGDKFFLQVTDSRGMSNFSDYFPIQSAHGWQPEPWSSCRTDAFFNRDNGGVSEVCDGLGQGTQARAVECTSRRLSDDTAALRDETWYDDGTFGCTDDLSKVDEAWRWNEWLEAWETQWVNGVLGPWWALKESFQLSSCSLAAESENVAGSECRTYRTHRTDGSAAVLYGNFLPVEDCVARNSTSPLPASHAGANAVRVEGSGPALEATCGAAPPSTQECLGAAAEACHEAKGVKWLVGSWSACSQRCGGGLREREVVCVNASSSRNASTSADFVDASWCQAAFPRAGRPASAETCNVLPCPTYAWQVLSNWSACPAPVCNASREEMRVQTRSVGCVDTSLQGIVVSEPSNCAHLEQAPSTSQRCANATLMAPVAAAWAAGPWNECSAGCGGGHRTRSVTCVLCNGETNLSKSSESLDDDACAAHRPPASEPCNSFACAPVAWSVSSWSACLAGAADNPCAGSGSRTRSVLCVEHGVYGASVVNDSTCLINSAQAAVSTRPRSTEACLVAGCESPDIYRPCAYTTPPCSGRGVCSSSGDGGDLAISNDESADVCVCDAGFSGSHCQSTTTCSVQAADGECCDSGGGLTTSGVCCSGATSILSWDGTSCCAALSPCGDCLGANEVTASNSSSGSSYQNNSWVRSLSGACCSGAISSDGECCDGVVDACGVCDGKGTSCSSVFTVSLSGDAGGCTLDASTTTCATFLQELELDVCKALAPLDYCALDLADSSYSTTSSRRRLASEEELSIQVKVASADTRNLRLEPSEVAAVVPNATSFAARATASGACGNGVCEAGELCAPHTGRACCLADCPVELRQCPVSASRVVFASTAALQAGANTSAAVECAGRGLCDRVTGTCACPAGYVGDGCALCDSSSSSVGWYPAANGQSCVPRLRSLSAPTPTPTVAIGLAVTATGAVALSGFASVDDFTAAHSAALATALVEIASALTSTTQVSAIEAALLAQRRRRLETAAKGATIEEATSRMLGVTTVLRVEFSVTLDLAKSGYSGATDDATDSIAVAYASSLIASVEADATTAAKSGALKSAFVTAASADWGLDASSLGIDLNATLAQMAGFAESATVALVSYGNSASPSPMPVAVPTAVQSTTNTSNNEPGGGGNGSTFRAAGVILAGVLALGLVIALSTWRFMRPIKKVWPCFSVNPSPGAAPIADNLFSKQVSGKRPLKQVSSSDVSLGQKPSGATLKDSAIEGLPNTPSKPFDFTKEQNLTEVRLGMTL